MSKEDPTGLSECVYVGRCEEWTSGSDDSQQEKSQTIAVTPGGEVAQLIHAAAGGDSTAAKKLWAAGVMGFNDGSASYELQASISSTVSDSSFGRPYQVAANTIVGKFVGGVAQVATDAVGQIPIAAVEAGTEGVQTPALPAEEIAVFAAGRVAEEAAGDATDAAVEAVKSVIHGNSKLSPRIAYLYQLFTKDGQFLKNGITQNPSRRYTTQFMSDKQMDVIDQGTRADMLAKERQMTIGNPGPLTYEPWARTGP